MKRRTVIVDDDPLWRLNLKVLCGKCEEIDVIGEAETVKKAANLINETKPDLVFLDIDLAGGQNGFDILPLLENRPSIVFVTSHAEYAIKAFEMNALHYLLKPPTLLQLKEVLLRLPESSLENDTPVLLKEKHRQVVMRLGDIIAVQSCGDYTNVHVRQAQPFCVHKTLKQWSQELPDEAYSRLDRFTIVRRSDILGVDRDKATGEHTLTLRDLPHLPVSASAARAATHLLGSQ